MHEYISLPQSGGQQYSIVVTGLDTDGAEPFVVAVSDVPQRDGILAISPPIIRRTFDTSEGTQLLLELGAREIGGQASFQGLNASATNLSSDTSTINAVNISFDISSTMVPAGGLTMVTSTIDISPQLPVGTYTGSFYFGPDMLEVPVELEIVGALMPDLTIENISYTSGTYEAGDLITISGMQRNNGTADVPAGSAYLIALCLSQNQTWGDADDIEIYSAVENLSLGVNQSRTGNWSAEIPENALPGSYFVAGRIDNSTSIDELNEGNNLWWSNTADITIFEQPVDNITITKMTAKAGKTRGTWTDSFKITGLWDAQVSQLAEAEVITISVGSYQEMISLYDFHIMGKKPLFNYRGGSSGIKSAKLDLDKGIFNITAKNVDLTGLSAPVPIEIEVGNYLGKSYASEVVINGTKTLPFPFLAGYSDKAWIEKAAVKQGKANNVGNLVVSGSIATVDDVDLTTTALTIHWGTNSYDISPGYFINRGNKYMCKKKSYAADPVNAIVTMDFGKCTFKVVLKNTSMNWESSPVLFGLEFGSFNEFMAVTF